MHLKSFHLAVWLGLLFPAAFSLADAPQPVIAYIYPAGAQKGMTVEAAIVGENVHTASEVRVGGAGVSAKIVRATTNPAPANPSSQTLAANSTLTVSFNVAPDAVPGLRDVRILTPGGLSNRFRFQVGELPETNKKKGNSSLTQAQMLGEMPLLVNGQIFEGDRDFYRFAARAGQTIVCQVYARALLPYLADAVPGWFDACVTLYDAQGHELLTVDDFRFHPDPVLIYAVPADGQYTIEIKDVLLRGRGDFVYRMKLGALPFVTHLFPLSAQRGTTAQIDIFGVNLAHARLAVPLAGDAPAIRQIDVFANSLTSNSLPLAATDLPHVAEVEPNDTPATAQRIEPPCIIDGHIDHPGDVDCFVFAVPAGQKLVMQVQARRLESPVDSILTLLNAKGQKLAENDDSVDPEQGLLTHHADSRIFYTFSAAGDYVLKMRDVQGKGGREYAYSLVIAPPQPDFALRTTPDNPRAAAGDSAVLTVTAIRKDGFDVPIRIAVEDLPPGFIASFAEIPAGQDKVAMTITAPAGAAPGLFIPSVIGRGVMNGKEVVHQALGAEEAMQAFSYKSLVVSEESALAVMDAGPFALALANVIEKPMEIAVGADLDVPIKVIRHDNAKGSIALKAILQPGGVQVRSAQIPADKDAGSCTISVPSARQNLAGITANIIVTGVMRIGKETVTRTLPAIPIHIIPAPATQPTTQPASKSTTTTAPAGK